MIKTYNSACFPCTVLTCCQVAAELPVPSPQVIAALIAQPRPWRGPQVKPCNL
jgi:hypothetical protein